MSALAKIQSAQKKKAAASGPVYVRPPTPQTAQDAYNTFAPMTPWRDAAGSAATGAASRLGTRNGGLLALLRQRATEGLALGGELSADEMRAAGQSGLASWSARGMGRSPGAGFNAMLSRIAASNARRREREAFAGSVAGLENDDARTDLATLAASTDSAYKGLEFAEDTRRFGINRDDTQALNESNFGLDIYTADKNADAAKKAGKKAATGTIIGGALGAIGRIF